MSAVGKPSPLSRSITYKSKDNFQSNIKAYGKGLENLSDNDLYLLSVELFDQFNENTANIIIEVYNEMYRRGLPMVHKI